MNEPSSMSFEIYKQICEERSNVQDQVISSQAAEIERLREVLKEARPYVEGMHKCAPSIRHEATPLLSRIDQALAQR